MDVINFFAFRYFLVSFEQVSFLAENISSLV